MKKTPGYVTFLKEENDLLDKVSPQAERVYRKIKSRINHGNGLHMSFPSQTKLAEELGYSPKSRNSVGKFVQELVDVGLISVLRTRNTKTRVWNANQYFLKKVLELRDSHVVNELHSKDEPCSPTTTSPGSPTTTITINKVNKKVENTPPHEEHHSVGGVQSTAANENNKDMIKDIFTKNKERVLSLIEGKEI